MINGGRVGFSVTTGVVPGFRSSSDGSSLSQNAMDFIVIVIGFPDSVLSGLKIWNPRIHPPTQSSETVSTRVFSTFDSTICLSQNGCLPADEFSGPTISVSYRA